MKIYAIALSALLAGASITAAAPMGDTATAAPMKKHHKHKKAMADSSAMTAPAAAPADSAAPMKKHHKHKKAMADSSAMK